MAPRFTGGMPPVKRLTAQTSNKFPDLGLHYPGQSRCLPEHIRQMNALVPKKLRFSWGLRVGSRQPEYPKRMMKYARRDFPCIRGCIRQDKASLLKTPIFNLLITWHKTAPDLQGTKPAVWLAVRSVCCQPVSPGFLPKFRGKLRGKIARVQGRVCGSVQARNFLPDSRFPCGTGLRSAGRERVLPGWQPAPISCQLRPCRPDIPDRRFTPRPACLPADRTGPVKPGPLIDAATCRTRSAERVRDFRAQGTGTSGGSRPVSECGQDRSASRRAKVFLPLAMPDLPTFFHRRYPANSGANPPAVSPRVSGGISFWTERHFVSDDPSGKFSAMITRGWRRRKSETKRNAKKSARRHWKVRRMTPTSPPRREGPVISEQHWRHPVATNTLLSSAIRTGPVKPDRLIDAAICRA